MEHSLQLLLLLAVIITVARIAGALSRQLGQPAVLGELLGGLLLGPTALNVLGLPPFAATPGTPHEGALFQTITDLAELGVVLLMFIAGLETNLSELGRVGRTAFWVALAGVLLPLAGGTATAALFGLAWFPQGVFVGATLTATSVSISAQTLIELGALRSKEGSTILGAAIIDDVMGILVLSVVVAFTQSGTGGLAENLFWMVGRMAAYFAIALACGKLLEPFVGRALQLHIPQAAVASALVVMFVYAWAAEYLGGVAAITGAYLAGALFARTSHQQRVSEGLHSLTYSLLVPVFFISIGLAADARGLGSRALFTAALIVVAIVSKAGGCAIAARISGFSTLQSFRVGAGMVSRGEVGLIVAGYGLARGLIDREVFSAVVLVVLVSTMVTPVLLRATFPDRHSEAASVPAGDTPAAPDEWQ